MAVLPRRPPCQIPVLVEEEEAERLDRARAGHVGAHRAVDDGDALPVLERVAQRREHLQVGLGTRGRDVGVARPGRVERQVHGQLPHGRVGVLGEQRVAQIAHPRGRVAHRLELVGLEAQRGERRIAVLVETGRPGRPSLHHERQVREVEVPREELVPVGSTVTILDGLDQDAEPPQLVLVALEHAAEGLLLLAGLEAGDAGDEILEGDREAVGEEGGEDVDPALDLGGFHVSCLASSAYCTR